MGLAINFDDPRYKKAVLAAGAKGYGYNQRGIVSDITSRFTQQQMGEKLAFEQMGMAKDMHRDKLQFANKQLKFERKMFDKKLNQEKKALNFTTIFGLGTGLYSAVEGRRRRIASEKLTADNRDWREKMYKQGQERQKTLDSILGSI
jgi:hypothetical protein